MASGVVVAEMMTAVRTIRYVTDGNLPSRQEVSGASPPKYAFLRLAARQRLEQPDGPGVPAFSRVPPTVSALARRARIARLQRAQRGHGAAQRADLDDSQASRHRPGGVRAVPGRSEEDRGTGCPGCGHLLLDPADRVDNAADLDLAGPGDEFAVRQVRRGQFVDDGEREHHPCTGAADVPDVD